MFVARHPEATYFPAYEMAMLQRPSLGLPVFATGRENFHVGQEALDTIEPGEPVGADSSDKPGEPGGSDKLDKPGGPGASAALAAWLAAVTVAGLLAVAPPALAVDIPSKELLGELRERLLKPDECFPHCLGVSELSVTLDGPTLRLGVVVGASTRLALPLPVVSEGWRPAEVTVDGKPATDLHFKDTTLWTAVGPGAHRIILTGPAPRGD